MFTCEIRRRVGWHSLICSLCSMQCRCSQNLESVVSEYHYVGMSPENLCEASAWRALPTTAQTKLRDQVSSCRKRILLMLGQTDKLINSCFPRCLLKPSHNPILSFLGLSEQNSILTRNYFRLCFLGRTHGKTLCYGWAVSVYVEEYYWMCMDTMVIHEYSQMCINVHRYPWMSTLIPWTSMYIRGYE